MSVAGVLLAAGASRRLGEPKQLLRDASGEPRVVCAARQLLASGCRFVVVVLGAEAPQVEAALAPLALAAPLDLVVNPRWSSGMGSSIACGIAALPMREVMRQCHAMDAALIASCDMPSVTTTHLQSLIDASSRGTRRAASAYAASDGALVHGIPAVLPRADWSWLQALDGERGARPLLTAPETAIVPLPNGALDLDTPDDVARWRRHHHLPDHAS